MGRIFYQPTPAVFGDCMPAYRDGTFYLFHQREYDIEHPLTTPFGWSLVTTTDFRHFTDHGEVIPGGGDESDDQYIFAGSVYEGPDGLFHAIYTGYNETRIGTDLPSQVILRASSADACTWAKDPRFVLEPQPGYDADDWRDPNVTWDPETKRWILFLGTRLDGPKVQRTGRTVWYSSDDASSWTFEGDLYAPGKYTMHEMADLFEFGGRWYILTTEYSDRCKTVFASGPSAVGPWDTPTFDDFDGRAFYAARTAGGGDRRFLFGWIAGKFPAADLSAFTWGGDLLVHELVHRSDGTLGVMPPGELVDSLSEAATALPSRALVAEHERTVETIAEPDSSSYYFEARVHVTPGTRSFSLLIGGNVELDDWYGYTFDITSRRLTFDRSPNWPWNRYENKGLDRDLPFSLDGEDLSLQLLVDGTAVVLYVNDVALSARAYEPSGSAVGLDVCDGSIELISAVISQV